jgi:hypothetical protein
MLGRTTKPGRQRNDRQAGDKKEERFVLPTGNQTDNESHRHRQEQTIERSKPAWLTNLDKFVSQAFILGRHRSQVFGDLAGL